MAFELYSPQPLHANGIATMLASYLAAKKQADAETARLRAQQQQHMADTIGNAIGNVGASYSQGMIDRYKLQAQNEREIARDERRNKYDIQADARRFENEKQIAKYRADLSRDDKFYDNYAATPQEAESRGANIIKNASPEYRQRLAASLGVAPEDLNADDPVTRRHAFVQSVHDADTAAKIQVFQARAEAQALRDFQIKQQQEQIKQSQAWESNQAYIDKPEIERQFRNNLSGIEQEELKNGPSVVTVKARQQLYAQLQPHLKSMKPVIEPATNYDEWASGKRPPRPGVPYIHPDGRVTTFDGKLSPHTSMPVKNETQKPTADLSTPFAPPRTGQDPVSKQWFYEDEQGHRKPFEPPVQKESEDPDTKLRHAIVGKLTTKNKETGATILPSEDQVNRAMELIKPSEHASDGMPDLPPDDSGWTPGERVKASIDNGGTQADTDNLINYMSKGGLFSKAKLNEKQASELRAYAAKYRASKSAPAPQPQASAPAPSIDRVKELIAQYGSDKTKWPPAALEEALRVRHALNATSK